MTTLQPRNERIQAHTSRDLINVTIRSTPRKKMNPHERSNPYEEDEP